MTLSPVERVRILIVDDHALIRDSLRVLLSSRPEWSVCGEAVDGLDAIHKAKLLTPSIVLMDISMPVMNGIEATRVIRQEVPSAQVVMVSQNHPSIVSRQAAEVGAAAYVPKTELARSLLPTIDGLLGSESASHSQVGRPTNRTAPLRPIDFEDFAESAPFALHWVGADGTILWANQAELDMLGYERAEYIGHNIAEFHADATVLEEILTRLSRGERLHEYEANLRSKSGSIRKVLITSSVLFEDGKFRHTRCFTFDITDRRRTEQDSALLAAILDSSDDAIFSKNLDGVITSWNKSAERAFGYSAKEAVGRHTSLILPSDRLKEEADIIHRLKEGQRIDHFQTVRTCKDGTTRDVSLTILPIRNSAGVVLGACTVARDITRQNQVERELRESQWRFQAIAEGLETEVQKRPQELKDRGDKANFHPSN
jgi:PAS domain S-box-containing protein